MIKEKKWYPVIYMFLVTAFFSTIVIGFTRITSSRVESNQKLSFEKAVLSVLPGLYDKKEKLSNPELHKRFVEKVNEPDDSTAGAYTLKDSGKITAYVLPISGRGFWAPIKAVIGIDEDRKTITGIAFYQQNETPGLGAEITKPEFKNQFKGKVIQTGEKPISIKRPGSGLDKSSVHAITGATQTSVRLENIINDDLNDWQRKMSENPGKD